MQLVLAPSNLGLSPLQKGHVPGTWRAPEALMDAGLGEAVNYSCLHSLSRPDYSPEAQEGTRIRNGHAIRAYDLILGETVGNVCTSGEFALVIGGDCSLLLGALVGARQIGPISLIHIDGHSDFRHPGNYDPAAALNGAAGMDLALATGRGEALLTAWPDVSDPLVSDANVIQIGERESHDPDFVWPDIANTAIEQVDIFEAQKIGPSGLSQRIHDVLLREPEQSFWIHFDVDVMDQAIMPAVDCPGSPGLSPEYLVQILSPLVSSAGCLGMSLTIYDPDRDPEGQCATIIIDILHALPFR
ncbi:arginase family protein [Gluconobacter morbifer]|uniref:Arginase n=1 Tax=Gluconobacter morbifer G707 TaxID=1088869 RepID=G6XL33_9PROT|nr:arginase family protein [Gluconobacter morbifer]EHH67461.1 arginase [Gluconobacter morbifer G707]